MIYGKLVTFTLQICFKTTVGFSLVRCAYIYIYYVIYTYVYVYICKHVSMYVYVYACMYVCMYVYMYLRRQQERDLMQKARLLTDQNSVSFQMFLILLSSITLCSESQIPVFKEGRSNT